MSTAVITETFKVNGVLADMDSVLLSDPGGTYGVRRNDTGAAVVADATAMTKVSTGVYRYTFAEPAFGLTYTYWVEYSFAGLTNRYGGVLLGSAGGRVCTLADVKDRLGIDDTDHDSVLSRIIAGLESMFDSFCGRNLVLPGAAVTEYYSPCGSYLRLRRYPVVSITSIKESTLYDFDSAEALTADTDYRILNGGKNGIVLRLLGDWFSLADNVQAVYRGGYAAAGASLGAGETALPDDIREAAIEQACFLFKRRDDLGLAGVSFEGGSITKYAPVDLLPLVKHALDQYRTPSL